MKKKYEEPEFEMVCFSFDDLLKEEMTGSKQEGQGDQVDFQLTLELLLHRQLCLPVKQGSYNKVKQMKNKLKILSSVFLCAVLLASTVAHCFAETYYIHDGYKYRDIDSTSICLSGWDDRTDTLIVPEIIGHRYVSEIDSYAFKNDAVLKTIDLTQDGYLREIGEGAFLGCKSLTSMVIPSWVTNLSEFMFLGCSSMTSLDIQNNPSVIPDEMCNHCTSLESFVVPDSVETIKRYAFGNCTSLSYAKIPAGVTQIASSAFYNCPNLTLGVYDDSYALQYAKDYNIPYVLLDEYKLGDVDGNGNVDIRDVTEIQKHLAELGEPLGELNLYAADVNGDGDVDISDATAIQMFLAELDFSYPIGEITSKSN